MQGQDKPTDPMTDMVNLPLWFPCGIRNVASKTHPLVNQYREMCTAPLTTEDVLGAVQTRLLQSLLSG